MIREWEIETDAQTTSEDGLISVRWDIVLLTRAKHSCSSNESGLHNNTMGFARALSNPLNSVDSFVLGALFAFRRLIFLSG